MPRAFIEPPDKLPLGAEIAVDVDAFVAWGPIRLTTPADESEYTYP
jgi:hypothetical protein